MECYSGHGVHVGLGNVLDHDWDIVVPDTDCLVIRSGDEPSVLVDKSNCVYRP